MICDVFLEGFVCIMLRFPGIVRGLPGCILDFVVYCYDIFASIRASCPRSRIDNVVCAVNFINIGATMQIGCRLEDRIAIIIPVQASECISNDRITVRVFSESLESVRIMSIIRFE